MTRSPPYTLGSSEIAEMGEAKHTPLPWRLERRAEFIIRACNAHDDLVAALKHCLREHGGFHIAGESERLARAALAKAEGHS